MRQQITAQPGLVPLGEVAGVAAVLAGALVLQADAAELVGQRQQELVAVEVACAVELVHLLHQRAVRLDLLWLGGQRFGLIGEDIQVHRHLRTGVQIEALEVAAGEQRRVDQVVIADRLEHHRVPLAALGIQRGGI
ncbi:hypothetical protein D3C71_1508220 [compost metagenome]